MISGRQLTGPSDQGLKKAESILLEPMYDFTIEVPAINSGRLLADLHRMGACTACRRHHRTDRHQRWRDRTCGSLRTIQYNYLPIRAGRGKISLTFSGYGPCADQERIVKEKAYDSERDLDNPTGSVFCEKGRSHICELGQG